MNPIYDAVCRDLEYWPLIDTYIARSFTEDLHLSDQYSFWAAYNYPITNNPRAFAKINGVVV